MDRQKRFDLGVALDFKIVGWMPVRFWMPQSVVRHVAEKHQLHHDRLRTLPSLLANPIMIFRSRTQADAFTVLLDARENGENLLVASHCRKDLKLGHIHDVRSVYPKDNQSILYWIDQGDLLFQNKEKSRLWLANAAPSN